MDIKKTTTAIYEHLKKYRFVALILVCGLLFMLIPDFDSVDSNKSINQEQHEAEVISISAELENILSYVEGAGAVKVMVTTAQGEQILYQADTELDISGEKQSNKSDTVLITGADKEQSGLVSRVDPPRWLGVIVICQGAENASVRLAIVDAVAKATGLGADRISVLKMK